LVSLMSRRFIFPARLDSVYLCVELADARVEAGDVIFRRHVLDNMGEHFAEFVERRFFGHALEVMSL